MKTTKEQLQKENAVLQEKLANFHENDKNRRQVFSELLDSYEWREEYGYPKKTKTIIVRDWLGIAFLIGELKADADYAMCIHAREGLKQEVNQLKQRIYELESPKPLTNQ